MTPAALPLTQRLPPLLDNEDALLPVAKLVRLLEDAARTLGVPDFGLRVAQAQDISVLGPVAVAIQNSPTVGEALQVASRPERVNDFAPRFVMNLLRKAVMISG